MKTRRSARPRYVFQFLVVLLRTNPLAWRRLQVPERYSFWDLHVAIQDAMGWKDYHLHEFAVVDPHEGAVKRIGRPDEEDPEERPCLAGWDVRLSEYFTDGAPPARYLYDFGDDWEHTLEYEGMSRADRGAYPRCTGGAGACPPEDVGGTSGYAAFLEIVRDRRHPEHQETLQWAGGSFDPNLFDPTRVRFDSPRERWKLAFEDSDHAR